jgi:adenosylcobinamide-GDP ribazoletransferase
MVILLATLLGLKALIILPLILIASILFNTFLLKKIGGLTGDTLGALNELVEVATLFIITVSI